MRHTSNLSSSHSGSSGSSRKGTKLHWQQQRPIFHLSAASFPTLFLPCCRRNICEQRSDQFVRLSFGPNGKLEFYTFLSFSPVLVGDIASIHLIHSRILPIRTGFPKTGKVKYHLGCLLTVFVSRKWCTAALALPQHHFS